MCGFVAAHSPQKLQVDKKTIEKMNDEIRHRGPDSQHLYVSENFMGAFSRLSIIDPDSHADQPFTVEGFPYVLLFNGEIYNYLELKRELGKAGHRFGTNSDTEVVFYSFVEWGEKALDRFEGMFAICLYSQSDGTLLVARDPLGIKPLYYLQQGQTVYFASEIKAFRHLKPLRPNPSKFVEYLAYGDVFGRETLYQGIYKLLPGERIRIEGSTVERRRYFKLADTFIEPKEKLAPEELKELIVGSILRHTRADVLYAVQLSGGLDSSLITSVISKDLDLPLESYSITLDHAILDESRYQESLTRSLNIHRNFYHYSIEDFADEELLKKTIRSYDYPLHHANIVPSAIMNEMAHLDGFKVLLSGDGADEFFQGYKWALADMKGLSDEEIIDLSVLIRPSELQSIFKTDFEPLIGKTEIAEAFGHLKSEREKQAFIDQRFYVQKWFQRQDRVGMAASVEIRVPLATRKLAERMNAVSMEEKLDGLKTAKYLLKRVAEEYLDSELVWRNKVGFTIPVDDWFRDEKCKKYLDILRSERTLQRDFWEGERIIEMIDTHLSGSKNNGKVIWALLNLELWYRESFE